MLFVAGIAKGGDRGGPTASFDVVAKGKRGGGGGGGALCLL